MTRLLVHVEGQTEETFVNEILREYLVNRGYSSVSARIMGNARLRRRRGGIRSWPSAKRDIVTHLRQDRVSVSTTMVDFYGMPQQGDGAWPGRATAGHLAIPGKAAHVERELLKSVTEDMGDNFDQRRFVPFVVIHEFEGLLFSDCSAFSQAIGRPDLAASLSEIRNSVSTPEHINDSPLTAPSKRVEQLIRGYEKQLFGNLAILAISLERIREACPHFATWLDRLDRLGNPEPQLF